MNDSFDSFKNDYLNGNIQEHLTLSRRIHYILRKAETHSVDALRVQARLFLGVIMTTLIKHKQLTAMNNCKITPSSVVEAASMVSNSVSQLTVLLSSDSLDYDRISRRIIDVVHASQRVAANNEAVQATYGI